MKRFATLGILAAAATGVAGCVAPEILEVEVGFANECDSDIAFATAYGPSPSGAERIVVLEGKDITEYFARSETKLYVWIEDADGEWQEAGEHEYLIDDFEQVGKVTVLRFSGDDCPAVDAS